MPSKIWEYDVFISYAREDSDWVNEHVYRPLLRCRTAVEGRRPRIFFDVSEEGIATGENFVAALLRGLRNSRRIVPVYSDIYFQKPMCRWELYMAFLLDPMNDRGRINPILKDRSASKSVPPYISHVQYTSVSLDNWYQRLLAALDLRAIEAQPTLEFRTQPHDITVSHTLLPIQVAIAGADEGPPGEEEEITVSCEGAKIEGSSTIMTKDRVATFADLSIPVELESTRLTATAKGFDPVRSASFSVRTPSQHAIESLPEPKQEQARTSIDSAGEAIFFADGNALAVVDAERVTIYGTEGEMLSDVGELKGRPRLIKRSGGLLAIADWSGNVYTWREDGQFSFRSFGSDKSGFTVPGDIAIDDGKVYSGFWNGSVHASSLDGDGNALKLRHDTGVQALAVVGDRIYVCGFDGNLCAYNKGMLVNSRPLEPSVRLLKVYPDCLLAIGAKKVYHIGPSRMNVMSEDLQLRRIAEVLGDVELPVVVDTGGKGFRINSQLEKQVRFHTLAGAIPVSADNIGGYCVFRNPDNSRTLLKDGRIVFSHLAGTLAVAPQADRFALGDENGIWLLNRAEFESMLQEGSQDE